MSAPEPYEAPAAEPIDTHGNPAEVAAGFVVTDS